MLFDDKGVFFVPAVPLEEVVDPTGAGTPLRARSSAIWPRVES